ncbi:1244_t:CDS:2 [Ambispora gerdemannii]|uniref:1244_t:CDS:1 n=1 Tax=Ambispora gerdemannii TaxID=144530 RepID=A0A9N9BQC4_9GLOM|nr:1244_t:CDS:2 [Ambispora gerdemannii]
MSDSITRSHHVIQLTRSTVLVERETVRYCYYHPYSTRGYSDSAVPALAQIGFDTYEAFSVPPENLEPYSRRDSSQLSLFDTSESTSVFSAPPENLEPYPRRGFSGLTVPTSAQLSLFYASESIPVFSVPPKNL